MRIVVEKVELVTRTKKDKSGTYEMQVAWAYPTRDGVEDSHPVKLELFPPRSPGGGNVPYTVGEYRVSSDSYKVAYGRLEIGFLRLTLFKSAAVRAAS